MVEIFLLTGIYLYCTVESSAENSFHMIWSLTIDPPYCRWSANAACLCVGAMDWNSFGLEFHYLSICNGWNLVHDTAIIHQISRHFEPDIPPFWTRYPTILDQISHHSEPDIPPFWIYFVNCIDLAFAYNITSLFKMHCICTTIHNCMVVHMYE